MYTPMAMTAISPKLSQCSYSNKNYIMSVSLVNRTEETTSLSPCPTGEAPPPPPTAYDQIRKTNKSTQPSLGWCRSFNDCIVMRSTASQPKQSTSDFDKQVATMKREIEKQKEMKGIYKARLERTQVYLRHCLQMAQDNHFLDLMLINNKLTTTTTTTQLMAVEEESLLNNIALPVLATTIDSSLPPQQMENKYDHLGDLINQAKMNGWYIEPQEIEIEEMVATGSTADVYRGKWRGFDVAVKCIFSEFFESNENGISFFVQETETLSRQRHPHVLQLMGACLHPPNHAWIVTELLCITLKDWLHGPGRSRKDKQRKIPVLPLKERLTKALEISQAMQYLHGQKPMVIHRDLKPINIFLDRNMHVRVADFGHARFLSHGEKALTGETGTYVYMAPEVLQCLPYDEKCDVYSFGIILNELITSQFPYNETDYSPSKIAIEVAENALRPRLHQNGDGQTVTDELNKLIQQLWDGDASTRPSFATITCKLRSILTTFNF